MLDSLKRLVKFIKLKKPHILRYTITISNADICYQLPSWTAENRTFPALQNVPQDRTRAHSQPRSWFHWEVQLQTFCLCPSHVTSSCSHSYPAHDFFLWFFWWMDVSEFNQSFSSFLSQSHEDILLNASYFCLSHLGFHLPQTDFHMQWGRGLILTFPVSRSVSALWSSSVLPFSWCHLHSLHICFLLPFYFLSTFNALSNSLFNHNF